MSRADDHDDDDGDDSDDGDAMRDLVRRAFLLGDKRGADLSVTPLATPSLAAPARHQLGRYRLDAVLGKGGMGVVHLAFDPELERKIALKVLRGAGSEDARARLLREARALAKLSHPHVITVFDVGSAEGQDFVAMELIDGDTLGEWVRHAAPLRRQILAAYVAAGRGLAAAHSAGLVHRDFKPSNVLRSRSGRIVVTDFGLARAVGADAGDKPPSHVDLATYTATGAIVGTPAYMAPEQWTAGEVTPATDQFAFCVALWEALSGERPYHGTTVEELKTGVLAGPVNLIGDVGHSLRAILRRGLAVDPAQRWPSMDALLAALERVANRRRRWLIGGGAAVAVGAIAVAFVVTRPDDIVAVPDCAPPAKNPNAVWSVERAVILHARDPNTAALIAGDLAEWRDTREQACSPLVRAGRASRAACLDAVLTRLDTMLAAVLVDRSRIDANSFASATLDPSSCAGLSTPRFTRPTTELVQAFTLRRHVIASEAPPSADELALADRATQPCARGVALLARLEAVDEHALPVNRRDLEAIGEVAAACDDDAIRAELALAQFQHKHPAAFDWTSAFRLDTPTSDARAGVHPLILARKILEESWDKIDSTAEAAIKMYGRRHRTGAQIQIVRMQVRGLLARGRNEDFVRAAQLHTKWLPIARTLTMRQRMRFEREALELRWRLGEVAAADAALDELHARSLLTDSTPPVASPTDVTGEVVDSNGAPVANADVVAALSVIGDSARVGSSGVGALAAMTRTASDGTFRFAGVYGELAAQAGALRSAPAPVAKHVRLVVRPTRTIAGKVVLGETSPSRVWVLVESSTKPKPTKLVAPLARDGTYTISGVPQGAVTIGVVPFPRVELERGPRLAGDGDLEGIVLELAHRDITIAARSPTPPASAMVWLFRNFDPGKAQPTLIELLAQHKPIKAGLLALPFGTLPSELAGKVKSEDLFVRARDVALGPLLVCGIGLAKQQLSAGASVEEVGNAVAGEPFACVHVAADQNVVVIDLPPRKK